MLIVRAEMETKANIAMLLLKTMRRESWYKAKDNDDSHEGLLGSGFVSACSGLVLGTQHRVPATRQTRPHILHRTCRHE